ncbi:hypothetical protein LshimejAT787_0410080 [Lyophyllum shimeji]|uniref:Uncharacterized protein n=1 Tax=Lyophyllum shimeji TaxID=47721 RepID=A0A9P3PKI4_LYOSH|nr:hypothetical protein LshimejAT787_0410080 [Lyophyllum shimeji]
MMLRSNMYRSVECHRKTWKHHKPACNLNVTSSNGLAFQPVRMNILCVAIYDTGPLAWETSFVCAAIVVMKIYQSFSTIDNYGMHATTGT